MGTSNTAKLMMRAKYLVLCLLCLLGVQSTARAATVIVTGLLSNPDGTPAAGYQVKLYAKDLALESDRTSEKGTYQVVKRINVDPATLGTAWYVACETDKMMAVKRIVLELKSDDTLRAKVDLTLEIPKQGKLTVNEALELIDKISLLHSIRVYAGEQTMTVANSEATEVIARILGRTDLGEDPTLNKRKIAQALLETFDRRLTPLPLVANEKAFADLKIKPIEFP